MDKKARGLERAAEWACVGEIRELLDASPEQGWQQAKSLAWSLSRRLALCDIARALERALWSCGFAWACASALGGPLAPWRVLGLPGGWMCLSCALLGWALWRAAREAVALARQGGSVGWAEGAARGAGAVAPLAAMGLGWGWSAWPSAGLGACALGCALFRKWRRPDTQAERERIKAQARRFALSSRSRGVAMELSGSSREVLGSNPHRWTWSAQERLLDKPWLFE